MEHFLELWPPRASAYAGQIDILMWSFTAVVAVLAAPVIVLPILFGVKYRRGKAANREQPPDRSVPIETAWSVIPFLLTIGFFVYAAWLYVGLERPPPDALTINVVAKQWMWKFQHPAGQSEIDDLHVPVGEPVKLVMISQDVIHSLYLPALRIKQDVLPGRYTTMWFKADRPGVYRVRCAEFCGTEHSLMGGRLFVLTQADYARWLRQARAAPALAAQGRDLYARLGCGGCHAAGAGAPPLGGLYGRAVRLADGRAVTADATYLRDSLLTPNKDLVAGYAGGMPPYAQLSEDQAGALIAYLQSLAPGEGSGTP